MSKLSTPVVAFQLPESMNALLAQPDTDPVNLVNKMFADGWYYLPD